MTIATITAAADVVGLLCCKDDTDHLKKYQANLLASPPLYRMLISDVSPLLLMMIKKKEHLLSRTDASKRLVCET